MRPRFSAFILLLAMTGCNPPDNKTSASPAAAPSPRQAAGPAVPPPAGPNKPEPNEAAAADQPRLTLAPDGLRWFLPPNGSARPIAFGTLQAETLASLERVRGKAVRGTNQDCGAGPVAYASWGDGLSLVFQDGRFAGWGVDGRSSATITTADGIGIGTTRAQLDDAIGPPLDIRQTSLGTEFSAGEYHGLLGGTGADARITDMWAGTSCVAR